MRISNGVVFRLACVGIALQTTSKAFAITEDWPNWLGPDRNNISKENDWSLGGKSEALWHAQIGMGYSSPSIAAGRLFIVGFFPEEGAPEHGVSEAMGPGVDRVSCLEVATGKELWKFEFPALAYANEHGGGALGSPTVHDGIVYVASRVGEVHALQAEDGTLLWKVDLVERHQVDPGRYGFASSPYVLGQKLVLNADRTVVLERATGETAWISASHEANYASVASIQLGQRLGLAVFGGKGLSILDTGDGSEIYKYEFRTSPRNVEACTPIVVGTKVFVSTGYEQGAALIDFGGESPVELWRTRKMRNKMAGCTLWEGHFYGFDESMLKCLDMAGEEQWRVRGLGQGALSIAGGRLLSTTSKGQLVVASASPESMEETFRSGRMIEDGVFWTAPVLSDGLIFLRGSLGHLVCRDHRSSVTPLVASGSNMADDDLPDVAALIAKYETFMGTKKRPLTQLRMSGRLDVHSMGLSDVEAVWENQAPSLWHVKFGLPPGIGGHIEQFYNGEIAWEVNPYRGDSLIDDYRLDELRQTQGRRVLLRPIVDPKQAMVSGRTLFEGRPCIRVDVEIRENVYRQLFFDQGTGALAGRSGADESTVVYEQWREVEGVRLPFLVKIFDADTGLEQRWRFSEASFEALSADEFMIPESLMEKF